MYVTFNPAAQKRLHDTKPYLLYSHLLIYFSSRTELNCFIFVVHLDDYAFNGNGIHVSFVS